MSATSRDNADLIYVNYIQIHSIDNMASCMEEYVDIALVSAYFYLTDSTDDSSDDNFDEDKAVGTNSPHHHAPSIVCSASERIIFLPAYART